MKIYVKNNPILWVICFIFLGNLFTLAGQNIDNNFLQKEELKADLKEVVIRAKKNQVQFKLDRQVINPKDYTNALNGSVYDLIQNLPSFTINALGEISFRGSSSFLIQINGKATQGDPNLVLQQLPTEFIDKIELISSPGAQFDADGRSGIINIITKKAIEDGWIFNLSSMGGLPPMKDYGNGRNPIRTSQNFSFGFRKNKIDFSGGGNYLRNDISGNRDGDVFTQNADFKTIFPSYGERSFKRNSSGGRFSLNYEISSKSNLNLGYYYGEKFQSRLADITYQNKIIDQKTNAIQREFSYFNSNDQQKNGKFTLLNFQFLTKLSEKSRLNVEALYEKANLFGVTFNRNLNLSNFLDTIQFTRNFYKNPLNVYRFKLDYFKTIQNGKVDMGYQFRKDNQTGEFKYEEKVIGGTDFFINPLFSNQIDLNNSIHNFYLQISHNFTKWSHITGLRLESSLRKIEFENAVNPEPLNLFNIFPSTRWNYQLNETEFLKFSYSKRIKRTNNYELNPFPEREHSETLEQGDPSLLPEFIDNFELGFEKTFIKGNFYSNLYYQNILNPIQRVNNVYNDTILNRIFTNAGLAKQIGLELNMNYKLSPWLTMNNAINIYHFSINGDIINNSIAVSNKSWVYSFNSNYNFSLSRNWTIDLVINYLSNRATAQGNDSYFLTPSLSLKKVSNNGKWSLLGQWQFVDLGLNKANRQRITTYGENFYTTTNYIYEVDLIQFSLSYSFNRKNRTIKLPQSEIGEKEF